MTRDPETHHGVPRETFQGMRKMQSPETKGEHPEFGNSPLYGDLGSSLGLVLIEDVVRSS